MMINSFVAKVIKIIQSSRNNGNKSFPSVRAAIPSKSVFPVSSVLSAARHQKSLKNLGLMSRPMRMREWYWL